MKARESEDVDGIVPKTHVGPQACLRTLSPPVRDDEYKQDLPANGPVLKATAGSVGGSLGGSLDD